MAPIRLVLPVCVLAVSVMAGGCSNEPPVPPNGFSAAPVPPAAGDRYASLVPSRLAPTLANPSQVTLFTLLMGADRLPEGVGSASNLARLDAEYRIVDSSVVSAADGHALIDSLRQAVERARADGDTGDMCFEPHHALRVEGPAGTVTLVVCFACGHVQAPGMARSGLSRATGVEARWREMVARYGLRDVSKPAEVGDGSVARPLPPR